MDDKVYTQEIVQENPFPGQVVQSSSSSSATNVGDTYNPVVSKDKAFPVKRTAVELLSTALNTRSRKILQQFELQQSGGLQIGNFQEGITGDIRITPNGLTGRDIAGLTTFAIDSTTGDVTLRGTLQAGTLIAGDSSVIIDQGSEGGRILLYTNGIPSILIGDPT